ncbi:ACT domain-containing protein [Marasmitruncus massiliensis]|uniref:ACT domain-containing protein n=1 Tax=Marasmitruncus massiliensis TaxID=1944642 RepID=UPI000C7A6F74|nr:ACT domain-containing protein [Marasmitruncus massiliensis]MBE6905260.1 ACT domain-containing protein [Oscillospiraceae bacterium]
MTDNVKFLLVDAQVLPEVFTKVVQAKMYLAQGKAKSSSQAAQMADISRSAFYKYKDSVYLYDERMNENIVTFYLTLEDRPGVLSSLLGELYQAGANIITVNQNIPVDGVALVSVSVRTSSASLSRSEILEKLEALDGIVEAKAI